MAYLPINDIECIPIDSKKVFIYDVEYDTVEVANIVSAQLIDKEVYLVTAVDISGVTKYNIEHNVNSVIKLVSIYKLQNGFPLYCQRNRTMICTNQDNFYFEIEKINEKWESQN